MTVRCSGTKRDGRQCTQTVEPPQTRCWWHDPATSERRRQAASRGGKGKAGREIKDLKAQLEDLASAVLEGKKDRRIGAVVNQIIGTRIRLVELERRLREQEELEARIEALETDKGGRAKPWGA